GLPATCVVARRTGGGLDVAAEGEEGRVLVQEAAVPLADGVRRVGLRSDAEARDRRPADRRHVAAQADPAEAVVGPEAVVEADGEDKGAEGAVDAGADLLGVAAQADPPAAAAGVLVNGIVPTDGIDDVVHRRDDLLGVAA